MLRQKFIVLNDLHVQCKSSRDGPTPMPSGSAVSEVAASPSRIEACHNLVHLPINDCPLITKLISKL